ncbi:hypothetical protein HRG_001727 [Hirsutella rhossiliensis]|uniref:Uncharacterized protein n=1 Tax=Hirsutella rhossiliensis TaxID=111463 RepID=A0A9P8SKF4_9HYPO|nr:uncharacterized protein HRG_01727 [Hirsutella rhossiliensis]KAH0966318.1 hypothetical protein HRG_01727 [Hirsutella rhossiliensis]
MSGPNSPFALFVLSETVDVEYINQFLRRTAEENDGNFFLTVVHIPDPSSPYACAPEHRTEGEGEGERSLPSDGTRPPIADSFASPFLGKTLEDCAKYLRATPNNKDWDDEYFCVLGEEDVSEDTVTLVRSFDDGAVHAFPCSTGECARKMYTALGDNFEEKLQIYKDITDAEGDKDRSVGEPYEYDDT